MGGKEHERREAGDRRSSEETRTPIPRLALRAVPAGAACRRELRSSALAAQLWPDASEAQANREMSVALTLLRQVLRGNQGEEVLIEEGTTGIRLAGQAVFWVDADAASLLLTRVEQIGEHAPTALPLLEEALRYFDRGAFLGDDEGEWVMARRALVERQHYRCRLRVADLYGQRGHFERAETVLNDLLRDDPFDEDVICRLMLLLHRQGLTHQAMRVYQRASALFAEEGIELTETTRNLVARFRTQEPVVPLGISFLPGPALNSPFVQGRMLPSQGTMRPEELPNPMDHLRRKFLQGAAGMLFPLFFCPPKTNLPLDEIVSHGHNIITACWHLMKGKDIKAAEELLNAYTPPLLHLTFQPSPYQPAIARIATQACMIRAIIAKHHLNPIAREMYCHEAVQCSCLSGERAMRAGALMYLGYTYTFCHPLRPQKAIEVFLEALRELDESDDLVRSDIALGLADAYALVNDEFQAKRAIQIAQDGFPSHPEQSLSFFYADCAFDTLYQWEAKMYLDLAQHNQRQDYYKNAENALKKSAEIHAVSERCMVETVIYQTSVALGLHDLDVYASCLETGVSVALQMGSQRRYQEALDLYQRVPRGWKLEPKIQNLAAFFHETHGQEELL